MCGFIVYVFVGILLLLTAGVCVYVGCFDLLGFWLFDVLVLDVGFHITGDFLVCG